MVLQDFARFDARKKDVDWFKGIVFRTLTKKAFLIDGLRYRINESFADGTYDISQTKKKYDYISTSPNEINIDFQQLDLLGSRIEAITSIIEKQGYEVKGKCTDPTAITKKEQDIALLKAEKELEPIRKQFAKGLGLSQPLPLAKPEDFSSDISPVKEMDLDMTNPVDEGIYKNLLQRQIWEIATEMGIAHYLELNQCNELLKMFSQDLIKHNCFGAQVTNNSYSGEPEFKYLYPYSVYTILGKRPNRKDAIGKGYEIKVSVREIIELAGKEITKEELDSLLVAANSASGTTYNSFYFPEWGLSEIPPNSCDWETFMGLQCTLGYLELKSQNSDLYAHTIQDGAIFTDKKNIDYSPPLNKKRVDEMPSGSNEIFLEYKFYDVTYKGYYIPGTNLVFGFGKLPLATRFGTKNELTDFSIITYKLKGKSMVEKCKPFVLHIFDLWCKYQHFINESRPSGESWDIDVIREIAQELIGVDGNKGDVMGTLRILKNTTDTVHKKATTDGQPTGGDGDPVKQRIRGIDPTVRDIVTYIAHDLSQIEIFTGINSVLLAQASGGGDTPYRSTQLYLQQSLNTIYYIQSALQSGFSDACFNICQKIQWILAGDKTSEAYQSVVEAIGQRNVDAIKQLGKSPPYSFSIFFEFGMNELQRSRVMQLTDLMVQAKTITAAQAMQIESIKNYKLASALLTFYELKTQQQLQQSQMAAIQSAAANAEQSHQHKMEELEAKAKGDAATANVTGMWMYKTEGLRVSGKQDIQTTKEVSKHVAQSTKNTNDIQRMQFEKNLNSEEE